MTGSGIEAEQTVRRLKQVQGNWECRIPGVLCEKGLLGKGGGVGPTPRSLFHSVFLCRV